MIVFFLLAWGLTYFVTRAGLLSSFRMAVLREAKVAMQIANRPSTETDESSVFEILVAAFWMNVVTFVYCGACVGAWIGFGLGLVGAWQQPALLWATPVDAAIVSMGVNAILHDFISSPFDIEARSVGFELPHSERDDEPEQEQAND